MQEPVQITHEMLASGNKRFINFIVDSVLATVLQMGIAAGFNWIHDTYGHEGFLIGPPVLGNIKYTMMGVGLNIVYYGLFESLGMRTPAKYITNTQVVNRDGTRPDNTRIFLRTLCRLIPFEFISFFGSRPVGLHDALSKTLVVDRYEFAKAVKISQVKNREQENSGENNEENNNYEQR